MKVDTSRTMGQITLMATSTEPDGHHLVVDVLAEPLTGTHHVCIRHDNQKLGEGLRSRVSGTEVRGLADALGEMADAIGVPREGPPERFAAEDVQILLSLLRERFTVIGPDQYAAYLRLCNAVPGGCS